MYIAFDMEFWKIAIPSLVFTFLFLICVACIVNVFNEDIAFETPILETLGMHAERLGGFCLGVYLFELL